MILRSGKYKGYSVREAWAKDPSYIRWVAENVPAMLKSHSSPTKSTEKILPILDGSLKTYLQC